MGTKQKIQPGARITYEERPPLWIYLGLSVLGVATVALILFALFHL